MPKLARKSAKLFAENATATAGGIAQFGSLAAGTPNYSKDPDVIQGLSQYADGWSAAVLGTKSPALEDRNALDYLLSYQQAYIMQHGVPEWISTETYYEHSYVVDSNGELRVSTIDNNIGHDPTLDNGGSYWGYAGARGSGKQIGEVYFSQSSSATDNKGALPLFTGEVIASADQVYPQFYAWVLAHTDLCKTEAEWQTAVTTYGECPFYVIDDTNKTIRLPKLGNFIKMANTDDGVTQSDAGVPNITGNVVGTEVGKTETEPTGAFYIDGDSTWRMQSDGGGKLMKFDASRSSSVYGNSNTVTPAHTTLFPWVFAYNSAVAASTAQAAQFQSALTSKADNTLANVTSAAGSNLNAAGVITVVETYHNGTEWCRIWSDGWCEQGGYVAGTTNNRKTVTFHQAFADTNYTVTFGAQHTTTFQDNTLVETSTKATTGFTLINSNNANVGAYWEAKGYIS